MIKSTVAVSHELDNVVLAAAELCGQTAQKLALAKNSFGLLICDSDAEHAELLAEIQKSLDIPIVGFTCTAMLTGEHGLADQAACLATITSDDVSFSVATSEPLTPGNVAEEIERTYKKALNSLDGEPLAVMAFPPYILGIMLDIYPRELDRVSGGLPVFGGLPAHDEVNGCSAVFCGDRVADDRLTILLLSGAAKPVFSVKNNLGTLVSMKRPVTHSEGNTVYRVGDQTFVEFLKGFGLDVDAIADPKDKTTSFTAYPLLVEMTQQENFDGVPIVRTIHSIDMTTGAGTAIGEIPQGATLSLGMLKADDIEQSASQSVTDILAKMKSNEADGYRYSLILAISCVGRYFVLANRSELEAEVLKGGLPKNLSLCGFYSFGEICPTSVSAGRANNAAHNESLVIMAL